MLGAAIASPEIYAIGNNAGLVFTGTNAGGGQWRTDKTPIPDKMSVQTFSGTVTDVNSRPCLGARLGLGFLTGDQNNPCFWLKFGHVGTLGDLWIHAPLPFRTDFGLCIYIPDYYWSSDWYFKANASFNVPRGDQWRT
jgi:hypothetical protein